MRTLWSRGSPRIPIFGRALAQDRADLQVAQRALPVGHLALDVATDRVNQIVFRSMGLVVYE